MTLTGPQYCQACLVLPLLNCSSCWYIVKLFFNSTMSCYTVAHRCCTFLPSAIRSTRYQSTAGSRRAFAAVASAADTMVSVQFQRVAQHADQRLTLSGACAAPLPSNHSHDAIVFGGYYEAPDKQRTPTNAAWLFSKSAGAWEPVQYTSAVVPQTRLVSQAVLIGDKLWVIGGWDSSIQGPDAFLGDVWTLDLQTWAWEKQQIAGEGLQGISRFQAVAVDQHIYIHTHRTEDHILRLDTRTTPAKLDSIPVKGAAPSSRGLHSMVHNNGALYVLFGAPQKGPMLDDVWKLDLASMTWEELTGKLSGPKLHARCSAAVAAVGDRIFVFGGAFYGASGGLEMLPDAFVLDTANNTWIQPKVLPMLDSSNTGGSAGSTAGLPSARNAAVMVPLSGQEGTGEVQLLLQGGWRAFVETYNDSYLVTLN